MVHQAVAMQALARARFSPLLVYGKASGELRSRLPCRQLCHVTRQLHSDVTLPQRDAWKQPRLGGGWPLRCCSGKSGTPSTEERIAKLETEVQSMKEKLAEVEKMAKRKGFMAAMMEYGAPFALWYAFCWSGSLLGLYLLLEWEVVSWQKSLRPFFESLGLDWYTERIDSSTGNLVIAFMVNELLEAVRFPLVLATSGTIIRWSARLRTAGATATKP